MTLLFQCIDIVKTMRMIQLGKYHSSIQLIIQSFRSGSSFIAHARWNLLLFLRRLGQSATEILTIGIVLLGTSCIFGSMIYTVERLSNPISMRLGPTVGVSVYYTILAITNVGLEGFLPTTYVGKWIACTAITIGLFTSKSIDCWRSLLIRPWLVALPLPLILSPYTRQLLTKTKKIIYRWSGTNGIYRSYFIGRDVQPEKRVDPRILWKTFRKWIEIKIGQEEINA